LVGGGGGWRCWCLLVLPLVNSSFKWDFGLSGRLSSGPFVILSPYKSRWLRGNLRDCLAVILTPAQQDSTVMSLFLILSLSLLLFLLLLLPLLNIIQYNFLDSFDIMGFWQGFASWGRELRMLDGGSSRECLIGEGAENAGCY
jgi:hypothetical protein